MKKIIILLLITLFAAYGCTRVPNSAETGVLPGQYEKEHDADELLKENENLNINLEKTNEEIERLKEENSTLEKNNEKIIKELEEIKSLLNILQNEEFPKFTSEKTDSESITAYLNEVKTVLIDSPRDIEIIEDEANENFVLFIMVDYSKNINQLFAWETSKREPSKVDGAYYKKNGGYKWLLEDKYLIFNKEDGESKDVAIVDVESVKVINSFKTDYNKIYLIPNTSSIIMKNSDTNPKHIIFDFVNNEEKEIVFDFPNSNLEFEVKNENIEFYGNYIDSYGVEYSMEAIINVDKFKEKYDIKLIDEPSEADEAEELEDTV